jgi:FKBP-type peptidyl-prolyl cis-trans isomerase
MRGSVLLFVSLGLLACHPASDDKPVSSTAPEPSQVGSGAGSGAGSGGIRKQQVPPPFNLKQPPADAIKTASGLVYKKLPDKKRVDNAAGVSPKRNDTVMINYTGWRPSTGETFFTNQGRGQPMPLKLSQSAPGFTEAMQLLHTGDTAVLWMPPDIGYKGRTGEGDPETLVYEVEVVEVLPAPAIPDDVGAPPAKATALKSGTKFAVVHPGTGKETVRSFDTVSYKFTAWDGTGRMLDTNDLPSAHAQTVQPFKQPAGMAEMLTSLTVGERGRFWIDAEKIVAGGSKPPGGVEHGLVCYEIEITQNVKAAAEPPPTPPDVAKPPADAQKTAKGVFYRFLVHGPGKDPRHPTAKDTVKVHYAGWTTDGKMFDSSYLRNEPATFVLTGVIAGWTDGIPVMTPGDRVRFWIPEELAYKGQAGKPQGMLVFEVELLEIMKQQAH